MRAASSGPVDGTLREHAIAYAAAGFSVFRSRPRLKKPYREGWQDEATTDPRIIATLWSECPHANVSLACGRNAWVLDVDGDTGRASIRRLIDQHGPLPLVPLSRTGSGGFHLFFTANDRVSNSVGRLAAGIDTRSAGGLIVLPPSIHPDGGSYTWLRDPWRHELQPAPSWLIELLDPPKPPEAPPRVIKLDHHVSAYARRAIENELEAIRTSKAPTRGLNGKISGDRHDKLFNAAIKLGTLVGAGLLAEGATRELLLEAARGRGIDERHAKQTVRDGLSYGIAHPREVAR